MSALMPETEDARWRTLYALVREADYGSLFTYAELSGMAEVDDIREDRWMVQRTRTELVRHDHRYLENLRGVGYRIVEAEEHLDAGNHYRKKSMRAAGRAKRVLRATDLSRIADPVARQSILALEQHMARQEQALRRQQERQEQQERRQNRQEERIDGIETRYDDRLRAIEERMRRMSGEDDSPET